MPPYRTIADSVDSRVHAAVDKPIIINGLGLLVGAAFWALALGLYLLPS